MAERMRCTLIVVAWLAITTSVAVATPSSMSVQGKLTDASGIPLPAGPKTLVFRIFDADIGGTKVWPSVLAEVQNVTTSTEGLWTALVGALEPLTDDVFADSVRWLEIVVDDGVNPATVLPRVRIVTGAYALRTATVDGASGGAITSKVTIGPGHSNAGAHAFIAGENNSASGDHSVISGGINNDASGLISVIGGGSDNEASFLNSTVGGGALNLAGDIGATVSGGLNNSATGLSSVVGGGHRNRARGPYSIIGGGGGPNTFDSNLAIGAYSIIGGGHGNQVIDSGAIIGGGYNNFNSGIFTVIAGGSWNVSSALYGTVGGGESNWSQSSYGTIGGGEDNTVSGSHATIGGGNSNSVTGADAGLVAGGYANRCEEDYAAIVGGRFNVASGNSAFVGGGYQDTASGEFSVSVGGERNHASYYYSAILGGHHNSVTGYNACIVGGGHNTAGGYSSFLGGGGGEPGEGNETAAQFSVLCGGRSNSITAAGWNAVIAGGDSNSISGRYGAIPGGRHNTVSATGGFAAGRNATAEDEWCFVWNTDSSVNFTSTWPDQFLINANGGVGIGVNDPEGALHVTSGPGGNGLYLQAGTQDIVWADGQNLQFGQWNGFAFTERLRVTGGGHVGIGTTSASNILTLPNLANTDGRGLANRWDTYSSRRWKHDIRPITNALATVQNLQGVHYKHNSDNSDDIGLIAEEVGKVLPQIVQYEDNGVDARSVDYARLVALLIEGMKEQQQQIDKLTKQMQQMTQ